MLSCYFGYVSAGNEESVSKENVWLNVAKSMNEDWW
jgi:hypothetical protein